MDMAYNLQQMRAMKPRIDEYFKKKSIAQGVKNEGSMMTMLSEGLTQKAETHVSPDAHYYQELSDLNVADGGQTLEFLYSDDALGCNGRLSSESPLSGEDFNFAALLRVVGAALRNFRENVNASTEDMAPWDNSTYLVRSLIQEVDALPAEVADARSKKVVDEGFLKKLKESLQSSHTNDKDLAEYYTSCPVTISYAGQRSISLYEGLNSSDENPRQTYNDYTNLKGVGPFFHALKVGIISTVVVCIIMSIVVPQISTLGLLALPIVAFVSYSSAKQSYAAAKKKIDEFLSLARQDQRAKLASVEQDIEDDQKTIDDAVAKLAQAHADRVKYEAEHDLADLSYEDILSYTGITLDIHGKSFLQIADSIFSDASDYASKIIEDGCPVGFKYWPEFDKLIDYIMDGRAADSTGAINMLIADQRYEAEQAERKAHEQRMYEAQKAAAEAQMQAEAERTRMTQEHLEREKAANEAMRANLEQAAAAQAAAAQRQADAAEQSAAAASARAEAAERTAQQNAAFQQRMEEQQKAQTEAAYAAAAYSEFSARANAAMADKRRADHPDNYYHNQGTDWQRDLHRHY